MSNIDAAAAAEPASETDDPSAATFAAKATSLEELRASVADAASVSGGLWFSYLFLLVYLLVTVGGISHRDIFFERHIQLPFLNAELPLLGFFVLGPLMFLTVHAYVLINFALLADKVGAFDSALTGQIPDEEIQTRLRRQLPSNIFVQALAGPAEMSAGTVGHLLRLIGQISLVVAPLALLSLFELQFLPYHSAWISWWQRIAVVADLAFLWLFWPSVARGEMIQISWRDLKRWTVAGSGLASVTIVLVLFEIATFPGEWLDEHSISALVPLHRFLVAGPISGGSYEQTSPWSNILVLPNVDLSDNAKFNSDAKIDSVTFTISLRFRDLRGAILAGAQLPRVDLRGAMLQGANLSGADIRGALLSCERTNFSSSDSDEDTTLEGNSDYRCADLRGANLSEVSAQGAQFWGAKLQGANFGFSDLSGASFYGASLQGAYLGGARMAFVNLQQAHAQGAYFVDAQLQGTYFTDSQLDGAVLDEAQLQGAEFNPKSLTGASLAGICTWNTEINRHRLYGLLRSTVVSMAQDTRPGCQWNTAAYGSLLEAISDGMLSSDADRITRDLAPRLNPQTVSADDSAEDWKVAEEISTSTQQYPYPYLEVRTLVSLVCREDADLFATKGVVDQIKKRLSKYPKNEVDLASALLNSEKCPGAQGLSDVDKERLRGIKERLRGIAAGIP